MKNQTKLTVETLQNRSEVVKTIKLVNGYSVLGNSGRNILEGTGYMTSATIPHLEAITVCV